MPACCLDHYHLSRGVQRAFSAQPFAKIHLRVMCFGVRLFFFLSFCLFYLCVYLRVRLCVCVCVFAPTCVVSFLFVSCLCVLLPSFFRLLRSPHAACSMPHSFCCLSHSFLLYCLPHSFLLCCLIHSLLSRTVRRMVSFMSPLRFCFNCHCCVVFVHCAYRH